MTRKSAEGIKSIQFRGGGEAHESEDLTVVIYSNPSNRFRSGYWAGGVARKDIHYLKDEICFLLDGVVRLTDADGHVVTYRAGDTFVIPYGFKGTWETIEPVRKIFAIHDPAAA
jgi:uncharacterized protein